MNYIGFKPIYYVINLNVILLFMSFSNFVYMFISLV